MTKTIPLLPLSLVLGLGLCTAGCDTVSNAADSAGTAVGNVASDLNPMNWFGSDDTAPPPTADGTDANGVSTDTTANAAPDLASLPPPPTATPTAQQEAAAQSLAADGAQARYASDSLRAGTEASAAPPPAADVPPSAQLALNAPPSANDAPPSADEAPPSAQPVAAAPLPAPAPAPHAAPPATASVAAAPSPALSQGTAAVPAAGSAAPAGPTRTALAAPTPAAAPAMAPMPANLPPGAEPAVPAVPPGNRPVRTGAVSFGSQAMSDAALGFKPSSAPPLDPSINQWVPAPIVARYRQTASMSGITPVSLAAVPAKGEMTSAGSANMGAVAAMNGGVAPTAVIYFPGDGVLLSAAARAQVKSTVAQFKAAGGNGSIRVVGHASSRTANMPVEKHLETIFEKSQQRANAVAQELIHEGVPADKVLVEAVGDSQPVYYESMPQGEEGNRRTEVFIQ